MRRPVIGVMGSGDPSPGCRSAARELGRLLAERGWIVLTGGLPEGVMGAALAGAKEIAGSVTLGVLPGTSGAGPDVDVAVFTGMGEARNAINVLTSDVIVACGVEGPGTLSEVALALRADKIVILLQPSEQARAFLRGFPTRGRLLEAAAPVDVARLLEEQVAIPRGARWIT
jgi:uncharacterized protein (TIGR00725 family)